MIKLEEIDNIKNQHISNDLQNIKKYFNEVITNSDQTSIQNLIEETKTALEKIEVNYNSITDREKSQLLNNLYKSWLDLWRHYKHIPEAIELIRSIAHITNYLSCYTKYFLAMSLINEKKVGDEETNSKNTVKGFQLLSETIDVFIDCFCISDLKRTYQKVQNILDNNTRTLEEYLEDSPENSSLITELRAYCSLIILRIKEHLTTIEPSLSEMTKVLELIDLSSEIQSKISFISQQIGLKENELIEQVIIDYLEEWEDIKDAEERLSNPPSYYLNLEEMEKELDLVN